MGFAERSRYHDGNALILVESAFREHGFSLYPFGGELVPDLQQALRDLENGTSKMLRYRPDRVAVKPGVGTLLVEIKSEWQGRLNFSVEFDAWDAARLWNQDARRVIYVFADLQDERVYACWPEDLLPEKVFVPRAEDFARISKACPPGVPVIRCHRRTRGSNTAFFLIAKSKLKLLDETLAGWNAAASEVWP